jgi:hypothetical protein
MLHWICPDCGTDCPPTVRECPTCKDAPAAAPPATVEKPATEGLLALARSLEIPANMTLLAPAPQQLLLVGASGSSNGNGHSNGAHLTLAEDEAIASLVRPLVESVEAEARSLLEDCFEALAAAVEIAPQTVEPAPVVAAPIENAAPVLEESPAVVTTEATPIVVAPIDIAAPIVEEQPVVETAEAATIVVAPGETVAPPAEETPVVETAETAPIITAPSETVASPGGQTPVAETAETAPIIAAASETLAPPVEETPVVKATETTPVIQAVAPVVEEAAAVELVAPLMEEEAPPPSVELACDSASLSAALELHAETVLHTIDTQLEAFESGIRATIAAFKTSPATALLASPNEIVEAPALPATQWLRTSKPALRCAKPSEPNASSLSGGALMSALAGPCLPNELRTFIETKPGKSRPPGKRAAMPAWVVSLLVAIALFLGAGSLLQYVSENRDAKAATVANPQPAQPAAPAAVSAPGDPHPLARFVEITGLRVNIDLNRKSQLQYLVVNHSSARLADATLTIAVRSTADSSGSPPLFTVSVVVPNLGPYQSKELKTDLDGALRFSSLPDWENLRADVEVSAK